MDTFAALVQKAAEVLGLQIERLWPKVVFVYWLEMAFRALIVPVAAVLAGVVAWRLGQRARLAFRADEELGVALWVASALVGILSVALILVTVLDGPATLAALIEPEGAYIRYLTGK